MLGVGGQKLVKKAAVNYKGGSMITINVETLFSTLVASRFAVASLIWTMCTRAAQLTVASVIKTTPRDVHICRQCNGICDVIEQRHGMDKMMSVLKLRQGLRRIGVEVAVCDLRT